MTRLADHREPESDGHTFIEPKRTGNTLIEPENDGCTLTESKNDGHTLMETESDECTLIKPEGDGHTFIEPQSDGCTLLESKSNGHTLMETGSDVNTLAEPESDGHILIEPLINGHTLMETENDRLTLIEPKRECTLTTEPETHGHTPTCSDTGHQVYAMSSIDKELEIISEVDGTSQMARLAEHTIEVNSSSSDSSESSSDDDLEIIRKEIEKEEEHVRAGPLKTKSELLVKDLPEVPVFDVTIDENIQLVELGLVFSIVESLVVVKALPQTPALDSESVLFLESRSCLGLVFETFGPVQTPFYSLRFNTNTDISEKNLHVGDKVFYAPDMMEYSNFVFVTQLKKLKGSDASWEHDEEPHKRSLNILMMKMKLKQGSLKRKKE
ncbi:H/ACA ribonucleoprotein complex non-core subunit naf1 [Desmophyllum pertusum]|uniref:H/ACA ribonucleoprotein complex non-core subunit NAF1 n=1 Tax=Desmophyllum pertusum TaxID=174260 RepID=A0A9W9YW11_9CNID|nr:H/ACA ribonucleoprotein complex non-core subunit naf1 [Desmophyllum pertusum]